MKCYCHNKDEMLFAVFAVNNVTQSYKEKEKDFCYISTDI